MNINNNRNQLSGNYLSQNLDLNALGTAQIKDLIIYILFIWIAWSLSIGYFVQTLAESQCQKRTNEIFYQKMIEIKTINDEYSKQAENDRLKMQEELNSHKRCKQNYKISLEESQTFNISYQKQLFITEQQGKEVSRLQDLQSELQAELNDLEDAHQKLMNQLST